MPNALVALLDLPLAWRRVKEDLARGRCFGVHPHERRLVEAHEDQWMASLQQTLEDGTYEPAPLEICAVPKAGGTVRPGGHLSLRDHVVYTACVGACSERIRDTLYWADRPRDFSYPIARNPSSAHWIENYFSMWRAFGSKSVEKIDEGTPYVVTADIAGFYENVDISLLLSDLRALEVENAVITLLSACLNKWSVSHIQGRGVPQGFTASDILARLYLHNVDRGLDGRALFHYRYVDDFRLFWVSYPDAKRALVILVTLLRRRGLVVQTAKSEILTADSARVKIQGLQPILQSLLGDYVGEIADLFGITDPYFALWDAEQIVASSPESAPVGLLREAYERYFVADAAGKFDKTLFHFLLKRLGSAYDLYAFPHCLTYLRSRPEETEAILSYVKRLGVIDRAEPMILEYLASDEAVYSYQTFQIVRWRLELPGSPLDGLVRFVRLIVFGSSPPPYLRAVAREFLARFGSLADVDRMEEGLAVATHELERAELICCIRRVEVGRRNGILARLQNENPYTAAAVALVRSGDL